ncbi:MAG: EAL domain-containing protein [Lysobacterales bacterium]
MTFRRKLQLVIISLLLTVEVLTFVAVLATTRDNLVEQTEQKLLGAVDILATALENRHEELVASVRVLTADFGFKRAVATADGPTLLSALGNHGARVNAGLAAFVSASGELVVSTQSALSQEVLRASGITGLATDMGDVEPQKGAEQAHPIVILQDHAYQVVMSPVRAPQLIGWVVMGFEINDALAQRFQALINVDLAFMSLDSVSTDNRVLASTLGVVDRGVISRSEHLHLTGEDVVHESLATGDFMFTAHRLSMLGQDNFSVILANPLDSIAKAFAQIRFRLLLILLFAIALSWVGALMLARSVSGPLYKLSKVARKISHGDLHQSIAVGGGAEMETLARAFVDMQSGIRDQQAQILHQAHHDSLTDLPNRLLLTDRINNAVARAKRHGRRFALMMLKLDGHRDIDETIGHEISDQLLAVVSQRMKSIARISDTVARIGNDEFGILLEETELDWVPDIGDRLFRLFSQSVEVDGLELRVGVSIGYVLFPDHGDEAELLLRRASVALSAAIDLDGLHLAGYQAGTDEQQMLRLRLSNDLRQTIAQGGLTLNYQPKRNFHDRQALAVEALVRWIHPELGFQPPDEFVELAERIGCIQDLTSYVLSTVIDQIREWRSDGLDVVTSVNLSAHDLANSALPATVKKLLGEANVPARNLILEVTESAVIKDAGFAHQVMTGLRDLGVALSIDDFGTGHSSLTQLRSMPIDELKIDKSFVMELDQKKGDQIIVNSTINLAHNLGLKVTAEGVENLASQALLESYRCDLMQGYLLSRPLDPAAATQWLKDYQHAADAQSDVEPLSTIGAENVHKMRQSQL